MGKKIKIEKNIINSILIDSKNLSIRKLANKYSFNKNVIIRILNEENNKLKNKNIEYIICKKTNKIFYDVNNKSGIITKHLNSQNILFDKETYLKNFNIKHNDENEIEFEKYLNSLRKKYNKKVVINGINKYYFKSKNIYIFFIKNNIIINNNKIKPIFLSKLNDRYNSSIFFYLDEWIYKKNIVKSKIEYSLYLNNKIKIYARKCIIKHINSKEKNNFLEKNHIQGKCKSNLHYGAYYNNNLVAVMCFTTNRGLTNDIIEFDYELNRFATDINFYVIGIASKMFNFFKKEIEKNKTILSFGDKRFLLNRKQNLYTKLNFDLYGKSKHDFYYIENNSILRKHKFGIQIKNKLIQNNKIYKKLWDCGKYKYLKKI